MNNSAFLQAQAEFSMFCPKVFRIKFMKDLRLMVKGLIAGIRTLTLAFLLLFAVLYVISGFATMTIGSDSRTAELELEEYFYNIPSAMLLGSC